MGIKKDKHGKYPMVIRLDDETYRKVKERALFSALGL